MLRHVNPAGATRVGLALVTVLAFCTVGIVQAQSTYVGASALADIARFSSAGFGDSPGGEAFGGAIRVGTGVTDRWGIDLEFTRPGEIEQENSLYYALGRLKPLPGPLPVPALRPAACPSTSVELAPSAIRSARPRPAVLNLTVMPYSGSRWAPVRTSSTWAVWRLSERRAV